MFEFKYWKDRNPAIKEMIHPKFSILRDWDSLTGEEKEHIWDHIHFIFGFGSSIEFISYDNSKYEEQKILELVVKSIKYFNFSNKIKRFCPEWTMNNTYDAALRDFLDIYQNQKGYVVFELFSYFAENLIEYSKDRNRYISRKENEKESDYQKRLLSYNFQIFDKKAWLLNETFEQYGVNIKLTRIGFIHRQEKVIEQELTEPVIGILSDSKFEKVNRDLQSALKDFRENKYAESITKFIAAFEEYIQICIGDNAKMFSDGIKEGIRLGIFPNDSFTRQIFSNTDSILTQMRKKYGVAHSPDDVPTQKDTQIVMNLVFVFIQHCS